MEELPVITDVLHVLERRSIVEPNILQGLVPCFAGSSLAHSGNLFSDLAAESCVDADGSCHVLIPMAIQRT